MRLALVLLCAAACSQDVPAPPVRYLDRPSDIAFGCTEEIVTPTGSVFHTVPISRCIPTPTDVPDGGVDASGPPSETEQWGFVVEAPRGTVAVANLSKAELRDSDPLTPGFSGLPVGRLPSEIATLPDGCYTLTANEGSCDLGVIDVTSAVAARPGAVFHREVLATAGPLAARPISIATLPSLAPEVEPSSCEEPVGLAYLAYPACAAIAVVDSTTGDVVKSVRFESGTPVIGEGDLDCPIECPEIEGAVAGAPRTGPQPIVLTMAPDGQRLYVGMWDRSELTIIELDAAGLPTGVLAPVALEGAIGLKRIAVSGDIEMGNGGVAGVWRFVYAVARDNTIHVIDVTPGRPATECDAQIDPRYLHDVTDAAALACIPIGAYPRRVDATGPGIELQLGAVPRDVGFWTGNMPIDVPDDDDDEEQPQPQPDRQFGVFAIALAENPIAEHAVGGRGALYYINVDDDNYEDIEESEVPGKVHMALALPHALRDDTADRRHGVEDCIQPSLPRQEGPPRAQDNPTLSFIPEGYKVTSSGSVLDAMGKPTRFLPFPRQVDCIDRDGDHVPVYQFSAAASSSLREEVFPDLGSMLNENYTITWEGPLTSEASDVIREAGVARVIEAGKMSFVDQGGEFCDLGVEKYDIVRLVGCLNDFDCGFGEVCFIHPDAPEGSSGMCVVGGDEPRAADLCRDPLISSRRYLIMEEPTPTTLLLAPRPVVLNSTPVGGCASDEQCEAIHDAERAYVGMVQMTTTTDFAWRCTTHAAFRGEARCVMSCDETADCGAGSVCDAGTCVQGTVPAPECLAAVQRYEVVAGDSFVVVGSLTGYRHRRIFDGTTCVTDVTAHPLRAGRFHKVEPPCTEPDSLTTLTPNPCRFVAADEPSSTLVPNGDGTFTETFTFRETQGMRIRLPGFTVNLADIVTPIPDFPGLYYSPLPFGYQIQLSIGGAFVGRLALVDAAVPERIRADSGGVLWVIDSGDAPASPPLRGQIIEFENGETGRKIGK